MDKKEDRDNSTVQVAVRLRPLISSEIAGGSRDILEVFPALQQIRLKDTDKSFSFNYVCDTQTSQDAFYDRCIKHIIGNLFKGYNLTILAYGQTGSGKTYSMGTTYNGEGEMGVIPRAVNDIFNYVNDNFAYDFNITVSFMELYQEVLYDLLAERPRDQCTLEIREDLKGILIPGLTEQPVKTANKTLEYLAKGSLGRATGSTNMNSQSSRSHAIFSINICMQNKGDSNSNKMARFHLVDLAGSERSKKTGATGVTFREGVNINKGLLALGNVISALGDEKQQGFIGYRDSNLTRLLKDSLGGNSITLMIACVSPADYNMEETVSTLRYADRARKIKNKPVINQDPKAAEINRLNKLIQQLRLELVGQGGPIICQAELEQLKNENASLRTKQCQLTIQLSSTLNENTGLFERLMLMQAANEKISAKLLELKDEYNLTLQNLNLSMEQNDADAIKEHMGKLQHMQEIFSNIDSERMKADDEIRRHESSSCLINHMANANNTSEFELNEKQESHTKQQMVWNSQLQEVTKSLAIKEHLAQQMVTNAYHMVDYNALRENEEKVQCLQKEKDELLQQLKNVHTMGVSNKIAEHRRKRVQELEKELLELNKKITEQARLIKLKEKDEQKIKQLNGEIQQMKCTKVKLIKNMKQESERFRSWKLQRERELVKLKDQDRKRQNQIVKMESMHNRQQNVLKRKVEEAAAINKRLKDALALRKVVHDQKNSGKIERLGPWIRQELEIFVSTIDAEATLTVLLEDRATLAAQLEDLKRQHELVDSVDIQQIEDDIEIRSIQIQEIQQKILDSDQGNKGQTRWENVQSMAEAKYCLKALFDLTADIRRKEAANDARIMELQNTQAEISEKLTNQEQQIKFNEASHQLRVSNMAKDYEEKIAVLLRQLRRIPVEGIEEDLQRRYEIQQMDLEKTQTENENLTKQNELLKQRLGEIKVNVVEKTPEKIKLPKIKKKTERYQITDLLEDEDDEHEERFDDLCTDPDWQKTPLARRLNRMKNASVVAGNRGERLTVKRGSDGGCACKGNCTKRSCGCKKVLRSCSHLCKCSKEVCANQTIDTENETEDVHQVLCNDEEDSLKRLRLDERDQNITVRSKGRTKKTKDLFVLKK